ncbi:MAG: TIGR03905 family TSCPD domain-containing protein [Thermodesulfobacteriota bacterium]
MGSMQNAGGKKSDRYIFSTRGVCPPEIHFELQNGRLQEVRFVGGGCPGNAELVSRLLKGKPVQDVLNQVSGILCRNETSCPDQLSIALTKAIEGSLRPARSFRLHSDTSSYLKIALIGDLNGDGNLLAPLISSIRKKGADAVYYIGNLSDLLLQDPSLIKKIEKEKFRIILGDKDRKYHEGKEVPEKEGLRRIQDAISRFPEVFSFTLGGKPGVAFYGKYLFTIEDFSDFDPFALEMNMVCNLTDLMQDETVFDALKAMIPHFTAQVILFAERKIWRHWRIEGIDIISVGKSGEAEGIAWGMLEAVNGTIYFQTIRENGEPERSA